MFQVKQKQTKEDKNKIVTYRYRILSTAILLVSRGISERLVTRISLFDG